LRVKELPIFVRDPCVLGGESTTTKGMKLMKERRVEFPNLPRKKMCINGGNPVGTMG